jgi:hypothetical protein
VSPAATANGITASVRAGIFAASIVFSFSTADFAALSAEAIVVARRLIGVLAHAADITATHRAAVAVPRAQQLRSSRSIGRETGKD